MAGVSASADEQQTAKACLVQGVGFHYRGAPLADDALQRFRKRSIRVLVATSGLSTGVNTPARAVIVRDLQLGQSDIEVSQIQQMFGRAGRAGLESEGYAYLLYPDGDRRIWQERLTSGYHVSSKLSAGLADAALAEVHLGNIASVAGLERWFAGTFAAHQSVVPASAAPKATQPPRKPARPPARKAPKRKVDRQFDDAGRRAVLEELVRIVVGHQGRVVEQAHLADNLERVRREIPRSRAHPDWPAP
jgi:superfamily II DNA or RNA helicase